MNKSSKIWSRFSFLFCKSYCDTSARGCIVRIRITPDQKSDWLAAKFFSIPMFWLGKIYQFFNHHLICYQELLIFHVQFIKMVANFLPIFQFAKKLACQNLGRKLLFRTHSTWTPCHSKIFGSVCTSIPPPLFVLDTTVPRQE